MRSLDGAKSSYEKKGQLVEVLHYKPEGRRFDSLWCCWDFPLTIPLAPTRDLGSTQPLTEMRTQEYFLGGTGGRCVWLTTLPPSCADCLEIWEPQAPGTLRACPGL